MSENNLEVLRQNRSASLPLMRGDLPNITGYYPAICLFIWGFAIFMGLFIVGIIISNGFHYIGLLFSLMLGMSLIFWPLVRLVIT